MVRSTFLNITTGTNGNTVTFSDEVFSTTFSLSGTGTVNFNGGFTSNTGSTMNFAGDDFINVGSGQTVIAAIKCVICADLRGKIIIVGSSQFPVFSLITGNKC